MDKGLNSSYPSFMTAAACCKIGSLVTQLLQQKHWNPRQRRKKEKAIRIFGDFLYCALCTTSLWTEMKNQRWKLFGIEILLQNIILAHHLASFWILCRFRIWPKLTPNQMKNDIFWLRPLIRPSNFFKECELLFA